MGRRNKKVKIGRFFYAHVGLELFGDIRGLRWVGLNSHGYGLGLFNAYFFSLGKWLYGSGP